MARMASDQSDNLATSESVRNSGRFCGNSPSLLTGFHSFVLRCPATSGSENEMGITSDTNRIPYTRQHNPDSRRSVQHMAIATVNPTTGLAEKEFEPHSSEEVQARIAESAGAAARLRATSYEQRAAWMLAAAEILAAEVNSLAELITVEMGKPIAQSVAEVQKSAKAMHFYAENAEAFLADSPLADPAAVGASQAWTRYEPLGTVLAVMPWNYPLWQVIRFAAPALMAGNSGLLKHASNVPQAALYLDDLF